MLTSLAAESAAQADPQAMANAARQAMSERRFADAAEIYARLAEAMPNEPNVLGNLGMALHFSGQDGKAIEPLRKAAEAMPSSFPAHFALGTSLARLGRTAEAVAPLRTATQLDPNHKFSHIFLGEAHESLGQFAQAAAAWKALEQADETSPQAHAGQVRCHEALGGAAIGELQRRDPESPYLLRLLGQARLAARQYPSALYLFRTALERQPGVRAVHEALASLYVGAGKTEWAAVEWEKATALPEPDCAAGASSECHYLAGRFDRLTTVDAAASPSDLFWAARSHARLAEQSFGRLTSLPETPEKLTVITNLLVGQGRFAEAAGTCRQALELGGDPEQLERQLAELLFIAGRGEEARSLLTRFHESDSNDPRWPAMLGHLLAEEQEFEQAIPLLEASLALPGAPASARLDLGRSYVALGRAEEALPHLQASVGLDVDGSVHYQLSQALQRLGRRDEAREALARYQALEARTRQETEASAALELTPPE